MNGWYRISSEDEWAEEVRTTRILDLRPDYVQWTCFDVHPDDHVRIRRWTSGSGRGDVQNTFHVHVTALSESLASCKFQYPTSHTREFPYLFIDHGRESTAYARTGAP